MGDAERGCFVAALALHAELAVVDILVLVTADAAL